MAHPSSHLSAAFQPPQGWPRHAVALAAATALLGAGTVARAQSPSGDSTSLGTVTITGRAPTASVTGFGSQPLATTPISATVLGADDLRARGIDRLAEVTSLDAAIGDAYNTTGYWDYLSVRGFVLDNRFNYRRDGLPINAETSLHLGNKAAVEILKGASGMQAGTSAPGGLANLVVKRPDRDLTSVGAGWQQGGTYGANLDLSRRIGESKDVGLRLNVATERLNTTTQNTRGERHLLALAGDWRIGNGALLEAEFEHSLQRQPSVPGFSMLGNTVPSPADPRINLNNQAWSLPVVLLGDTASLRWTQPLAGSWKLVAHGMTQRLKNDDRIAFPYGCTDSSGNWYGDRYCPDGSVDLYDFRSENERRRSDALDLGAQGRFDLGPTRHELASGVLLTRYTQRMQKQAYNWAGTGTVNGLTAVPAAPDLTDENTNRDERSTELYLRDAVRLAPTWQLWAGLRHTLFHRESVRTNGSRATAYDDQVTSPWLALSWEWAPQHIAYASWGRGMESEVAPNRSHYRNRGEVLLSRSRQLEAGLKGSGAGLAWSTAVFDLLRPQTNTVGTACSSATADSCTLVIDGNAHHRGLEGQVEQSLGDWRLAAGGMWLHASREGSSDPTLNGRRPPNVPERTLRARATYLAPFLPGLSTSASLVHEGDRTLTPRDANLRIPSWTRLDLAAQWTQNLGERRLTWSAGIDNATNRRAWREAPYQFEHIYLFPLAERTARLGLTVDL
jgi:iron complex outermembrane receptor protein